MSIRNDIAIALALTLLPVVVLADGLTSGQVVIDLSSYAKISDVPTAASLIPPTDVYGGAVGSMINQFPRADAARPRITRSMLVTLDAAGTATASWSSQPLAVAGIVNLTPIYSGAGIPKCWLTADPTSTTAPIKCAIENTNALNLSIITAGITLNSGTNAAGMKVNVVVLPPSQ